MDASRVEIVRGTAEDESDVAVLMEQFNQTEDIVWEPTTMLPALRQLLEPNDLGLILVARDPASGSLVGYGLATFGYDVEFAGRDAFLTELFVAPAARRRGIGCSLLDAMVQRLRECRVNAVHLMVRPENERARALYEKRGFQVAPRIMMTKRLESETV